MSSTETHIGILRKEEIKTPPIKESAKNNKTLEEVISPYIALVKKRANCLFNVINILSWVGLKVLKARVKQIGIIKLF